MLTDDEMRSYRIQHGKRIMAKTDDLLRRAHERHVAAKVEFDAKGVQFPLRPLDTEVAYLAAEEIFKLEAYIEALESQIKALGTDWLRRSGKTGYCRCHPWYERVAQCSDRLEESAGLGTVRAPSLPKN